ncbi:MAG TPA: hypothetical protein VFO95_16260, partial [Gemmatimonadales bacterium]|nr:hypothetical protein [Gemmatimonadales bacterium]
MIVEDFGGDSFRSGHGPFLVENSRRQSKTVEGGRRSKAAEGRLVDLTECLVIPANPTANLTNSRGMEDAFQGVATLDTVPASRNNP